MPPSAKSHGMGVTSRGRLHLLVARCVFGWAPSELCQQHAPVRRCATPAMPKKEAAAAKSAKVGNLYLQVLSAGSSDAPPGLLLFCELHGDRCGYLINCGEGTQRFCTEHKLRLAGKLRRALFTRMTWDELGGLPGMLLTMASTGHAGSLHLHGAPALPRLVNNFCHFMPR